MRFIGSAEHIVEARVRAALESNISDRCRVANKREFIARVMVTISAEAGAARKTATPAHKRKSVFVACQGPRSVSVFMMMCATLLPTASFLHIAGDTWQTKR